ncbi:hypothetical protein L2E82_50506 [Cichorium intybus]|nr:hypothetical protein L2E82_50506 [Cichorium intybus]
MFGKSKKKLDPEQEQEKRVVLETIVVLLLREKNAISISFLSMLLRAAKYLDTTVSCILDLEKRMGLQLAQAVLDDILIPSFSFDGDTLFDVDTVQQMMKNYIDNSFTDSSGIDHVSPTEMKVAEDGMYRAIDIYLKVSEANTLEIGNTGVNLVCRDNNVVLHGI